jgi:hypothetical protein
VSAGNNLVIVPMTVSDSYTAKAITEFSITDPVEAAGVVNEEDKTVTVAVPYGTEVTGMTTSIVHTGASINPDNGTTTDFTNPVIYTVTAADGSTQNYTVTVIAASSTAKEITAFSITSPVSASGVVNEADKTVTVTVPYGTAVTGMTTSIAHTGVSISPDNGTAANFTNPVTYTVTAADGSTQDYTVTVTVLGQGTVLFLEDETFTLTAGTISWLANTPVTVNAPAAYDSYQWYMDNALISGATNNSYTFNGGDYSPGAHTLSVRVIKNGQSYSKTLNFTISVN